jgi:hypothetical protein
MKRKKFDSVKMMREIRDKLNTNFRDPKIEEKELKKIRKKFDIKSEN